MKDPLALQGLCLGLLMLAAHFGGRLALKLRIGQMIGQLLGGVIIGPSLLKTTGLLDRLHLQGYEHAFESFHFLIFTFLGVIAFALGEELHFDRLREVGVQAAAISLFQGGVTWVLLTVFFLLTGMQWPLALVIGSIGVATAPAITFVLLNQFEIEGRFRNMVANILVLDDVLEVVLFSIFAQTAFRLTRGGQVSVTDIGGHLVKEFGLAILLGTAIFVFLKLSVRSTRMDEDLHEHAATLGPGFISRLLSAHPTPSVEVLVVVIGAVSIGSALGLGFHLPFLIIGVTAGVLIANLHNHALFDALKIDNIMPLLNLVFFALIGANIHFEVFHGGTMGLVGGYVVMRGVGKIAGTWAGCRLTGQDPKVTACLPFLMLPQAGVAAVEAVYVVMLLGDAGRVVADVVLPALIIFEITGVFFSERALLKWRQWTTGERGIMTGTEKALRDIREQGGADDILHRYVPEGLAGIRLRSNDLSGVVRELAGALAAAGAIRMAPDDLTTRVMAREKMESTGIGRGIMIPHAKVSGLDKSVAAVGSVQGGLTNLTGPDGKDIRTVVLLVSPDRFPEEHLRALGGIARYFAGKEKPPSS